MRASPEHLDPRSRYYPCLRDYRELAGLTQLELARRAGFRSATPVAVVERGGYCGVIAETLIARALDLSPWERALAFGYPGNEPTDLGREREERRRSTQPKPLRDARSRPGSGAQ